MSKQEMKKNKNPKIVDMLFARSWCAVCVKGRCVGKHLQVEPLEEEERERTTPMVAFDYVFLTPENADIFPILICRDHVCGRTGAT